MFYIISKCYFLYGSGDHELCPQTNSALSALLIQMLLALQPHLLKQKEATHWPSALLANNELFQPAKASTTSSAMTTVWTSSVVSTVIETSSKVISIWFRNERIPTTLYSSATRLVTDYVTMTSTVELSRRRREVEAATLLDPSFSERRAIGGLEFSATPPLVAITELPASPTDPQGLPDLLTRPRVLEAWSNFVHVLAGETKHSDHHSD